LSQVAGVVKSILKPFYAKGSVDKETFKVIMKKSVDKILPAAALGSSVNKEKVRRLVEAYVDKYKRKN
jgi:hypothetical protein